LLQNCVRLETFKKTISLTLRANDSVYVLSMSYDKTHISIHKIQLLFKL